MQKTDFLISRDFFETAYPDDNCDSLEALGNTKHFRTYVLVPITKRSLRELRRAAKHLIDNAVEADVSPVVLAAASDVRDRANGLLDELTPSPEPVTLMPDDFSAPKEHVKAALSGQGRGFYEHLMRAVVVADSRNLERLKATYPNLVRGVLEAYGRNG